jgi:hypothetical protein
MDWLIWQLIYDITMHYQYARFFKFNGFVQNTKQEFVIALAIIRAREIRDENVNLYLNGENLAYVVSVNNFPKVYTVYCHDSIFPQCNCPIGMQRMIYKHFIKAFQLIHLNLEDDFILRSAGSTYNIDNTVSLSQALQPPREHDFPSQDEVLKRINMDVFKQVPLPSVVGDIKVRLAIHPIDLFINSSRR